MSDGYTITSTGAVADEGSAEPSLLHDVDQIAPDNEIDALVASGDCFVTMASNLDALHAELIRKGTREQPELEKTVRTLFYLQRHYAIIKKHSDYRQ